MAPSTTNTTITIPIIHTIHTVRTVRTRNGITPQQPTYIQPQPQTVVQDAEPERDAPVPVKVKQKEKEVEPELNPINLRGRAITKMELKRGNFMIAKLQDEALDDIEEELEEVLLDKTELFELYEGKQRYQDPNKHGELLKLYHRKGTRRIF